MPARLRLLLATALVLVVTLAVAVPAGAQTATTDPPRRPDTECVSANPPPDCYDSQEFERSSRAQLLLFGAVILGLVGIGAVVVRSTMRRDRARRGETSRT